MKRKGPESRPARVREAAVAPFAAPIPAGEFKARCLALMDEVNARGISYVITKRGKPVAKLVPVGEEGTRAKRPRGYGALKGSFEIHGDIVGPVEEWPETFDEQNL